MDEVFLRHGVYRSERLGGAALANVAAPLRFDVAAADDRHSTWRQRSSVLCVQRRQSGWVACIERFRPGSGRFRRYFRALL
jgi:hypothetical protein